MSEALEKFWADREKMEKVLAMSCEDQIRTLEESAKLTCDYEATAVGEEVIQINKEDNDKPQNLQGIN